MTIEEKTCPQCAEQVKAAARICRFCGHDFTLEEGAPVPPAAEEETAAAPQAPASIKLGKPKEPEKKDPVNGNSIAMGCAALVGLTFLLAMCGALLGDDKTPGGSAEDVETAAEDVMANADAAAADVEAAVAAEPPEPQSDWRYFDQEDELRGRTTHFAQVTSNNSVRFDFPYQGGSRLTMTVRQSPQYGQDVYFTISKGQFTCGIYNCAGAISFDGASEKLTLTTPDDHSSDTLFATYDGPIIRKLKAADKVIVELPFFQEGNRQFTFDTANLEWPPE